MVEPLPAVLLAAGGSRRLGQPKQLVRFQGETLVHRAARLSLEAGFAPVLVVMGAEREAVAAALADLPVTCVPNPEWATGLASSIRAGIARLPSGCAGALLLACDQVALTAAHLAALRRTFRAAPGLPAASAYGGGLGIPALFPPSLFPDLAHLQGDRGAKALLDPGRTTAVAFPEGRQDVDTLEDLQALHRQVGG